MSGRGRRKGQWEWLRKERRTRTRRSKQPVPRAVRERPPVHASRTHHVPPMRKRWVERWHKNRKRRRRLQMQLELDWRSTMERRAAQRLTRQLRERQEKLLRRLQQRRPAQHQHHQCPPNHSPLHSPRQRQQLLQRVKVFACIAVGSFVLPPAPPDRRRVFAAASVVAPAVAPTMAAAVVAGVAAAVADVRSWFGCRLRWLRCVRGREGRCDVKPSLRSCFNRCST